MAEKRSDGPLNANARRKLALAIFTSIPYEHRIGTSTYSSGCLWGGTATPTVAVMIRGALNSAKPSLGVLEGDDGFETHGQYPADTE